MMQENIHKEFDLTSYSTWKSLRNIHLQKKTYTTEEYYFFSVLIEILPESQLTEILTTIESINNQSHHNIEVIIINCEHLEIPPTLYAECMSYRGLRKISVVNKFDLFRHDEHTPLLRGDFAFIAPAGTTWDSFAFALINLNLNMAEKLPDIIICDSDEVLERNFFTKPVFISQGDNNLLLSVLNKPNVGLSTYFMKKNYKTNSNQIQQWFKKLTKNSIAVSKLYIHENIVHYQYNCFEHFHHKEKPSDKSKLIDKCISIIIPNKDNVGLLKNCLAFLDEKRSWQLELIIVDNHSQSKDTWEYYKKIQKKFNAKIVEAPYKFNFARMINIGASVSSGSVLIILNNDIKFTLPGQIERLILEAMQPEIGVVGSLLLNEDHTINHAGIILDPQGFAGHILRGANLADQHVKKFISNKRDYSAVTGALLATRREVFETVEGMDEVNLAVEFNDIDFCLKVRELGLNIVHLPLSGVIHKESSTRRLMPAEQISISRSEAKMLMLRRWPEYFKKDPYQHPNLIISESSCIKLNHVNQ